MALNAGFFRRLSPNSKTREPSLRNASSPHVVPRLCDNGAGSGRLVLPGRGQDADGLVVTGQTVNSRLDKNEAELGVLVLAVALKMLADGNGLEKKRCEHTNLMLAVRIRCENHATNLLDQHVQVLGDIGGEAY